MDIQNPSLRKASFNIPLESRKSSNFDQRGLNLALIRRKSSLAQSQEFVDEKNLFEYIIMTLKNVYRANRDIQLISLFLNGLNEFMNLVKQNHENYRDLANIIASKLMYEYFPEKRVVLRIGEKGNKFYVILKGRISILIPKDITVSMTEAEYYEYLENLLQYKEKVMYKHCVETNIGKIPFKEVKNLIVNDKPDFFSLEDYLNRIYPHTDKNNRNTDEIRYSIKVWIYHKIMTLKEGDYFGDTALLSHDNKRTATIFTEQECHLGFLFKENYDKCLKEVNENKKNSNLGLLLSNKIFESLKRSYFVKNYSNYFVTEKYNINEFIFKEGDISNEVYFIKEGEIEISMKKSLYEINELIVLYGGLSKKSLYEHQNSYFEKLSNEKKTYKVSLLRNKEIIGLKDMIINNKFYFSAKCILLKCELFKIENEFFELICDRENSVNEITNSYVKSRRKYILDRLNTIRENRFNNIRKQIETHSEINLRSKGISINFNVSTNSPTNFTTLKRDFIKEKQSKNSLSSFKLDVDNNASRNKNVSLHSDSFKLIFNDLSKKSQLIRENSRTLDFRNMNTDFDYNLLRTCKNFGENKIRSESFVLKRQESEEKMKQINDNILKINQFITKINQAKEKSTNQNKFRGSSYFNGDIKIKKKFSELMKKRKMIKSFYNLKTDFSSEINLNDQLKKINEFVRINPKRMKSFVYDKLASHYYSDKKIETNENENIIDCLALDNFNRIFVESVNEKNEKSDRKLGKIVKKIKILKPEKIKKDLSDNKGFLAITKLNVKEH